MKLAVLTAYSPNFKRIASLCTPSHQAFVARTANAEFFELPLPHDGKHQWRKLWLTQDFLTKWHSVLWLDADCIVPADWDLPSYRGNYKFFFPRQRNRSQLHAGYWINSSEAFDLLNAIFDIHQMAKEVEAFTALDLALRELKVQPGELDPGLLHHSGKDWFEKQELLRCETMA